MPQSTTSREAVVEGSLTAIAGTNASGKPTLLRHRIVGPAHTAGPKGDLCRHDEAQHRHDPQRHRGEPPERAACGVQLHIIQEHKNEQNSLIVVGNCHLNGPARQHRIRQERAVWRLFVSDHSELIVTVFDPVKGAKIDSFTIKGPASLERTASGRTVFAVQGKADTVTAIASGISFEDHGDHGDIDIEAPKLTGVEITGKKPSHFVDHDGTLALFFDGDGVARLATEKAVLEAKAGTTTVNSALLTTVSQQPLVVTRALRAQREKPDELPIGINVFDKAAQRSETHACPDLHGEAASGNLLAFACASGLLVVSSGESGRSVRYVAYPDALPDGKATTLLGGKGLQYFLGNYGADKIVLIDPTENNGFRLIDLPTRRVHFAVDPVRAKFAYVFTEDGQLHQINVVAGTLAKSLKLTEPNSMEGHWSDPRPRVAVAGDRIAVTDPLKGVIHLVDVESFAKASDITVPGKPFNIVSVGGSGQTHEEE